MSLTKRLEIENSESCWNRARDDEPVFVLLGRDVCAPGTVLDWCGRRIMEGKNVVGDSQIVEARGWADAVLAQQQQAGLGPLFGERRTSRVEAAIASFRVGLYRHHKGGLYTALGLVTHHHVRLPYVKYVSHTYGGENVRPLVGWHGDRDGWADVLPGGPRFEFVGALPSDVEIYERVAALTKPSGELFEVGAIVHYAAGPTALMCVREVHVGHGGSAARYYGEQLYGGTVGAYHEDCRAATVEDQAAWARRDAGRASRERSK